VMHHPHARLAVSRRFDVHLGCRGNPFPLLDHTMIASAATTVAALLIRTRSSCLRRTQGRCTPAVAGCAHLPHQARPRVSGITIADAFPICGGPFAPRLSCHHSTPSSEDAVPIGPPLSLCDADPAGAEDWGRACPSAATPP
jgi:hypothetical protein